MSGGIVPAVVKLSAMNLRGFIFGMATAVAGLMAAGATLPPDPQPTDARPVSRAVRTTPVVLELFTAQGCAGCSDADRMVEDAADTPGVIVLTYGVDYWDYLGWADTFARPEFAARQHAYRQALRLRSVSTPQVVIDGYRQVSGARSPELQTAIDEESVRRDFPPEIEFRAAGDRVGIGSGRPPEGGAEVVVVTYTPGLQSVQIDRGDNRGQTVRQLNVVRGVTRLGNWTGRSTLFALPPKLDDGDEVVVLLQARADHRILTAAQR
ncbi:DUF1223 domain-containing protein [uncultured Brevundimonas sp.]|uniref:DUF1223 domain-containing protein n=1 Tax=uncultured Brevundimonas sp. TaxID=213418 RepID=UPI0030EE767D|tara:strand:- start:25556 stop:26353 length:798 start_codon:yes stop_codon:yes gene_type:complete